MDDIKYDNKTEPSTSSQYAESADHEDPCELQHVYSTCAEGRMAVW